MSEGTGGSVLQARPLSQFTLRLLGDRQLVRLAARGHMSAFEAIFRRYHQELFRSCRGILGDPDEAEDAVQNTMAAALRALPEERREIALRPWLHRIAHNEAVSIMRRRVAVADPESEAEPAGPGADSQAEARERLRQLVADLEGLPDRQRAALVMREVSGLSYTEIGSALDLSATRARQTVYEARVALQELEGGREMECDEVRRALSERDGRVLRGRRLRSHLRACEGCRDFREGIERRRYDLESLCPPLPPAAASGLLASILGKADGDGTGAATGSATAAGVAGAGAAGGGVGATIAASIAVKGASLVAAGAFGAAAAGATGVVDTPWTPDHTRSGMAETTSDTAERPGGQASPTTADLDRPPGVVPDRSADTGDGAASPATSDAAPPDEADVDQARPAGAGGEQSAPADGAPPEDGQPEDAGGHGGSPPQTGGPHEAPAHPSPPQDQGGHSGAPPHAGGPQGAPAHPSPPEDPGGHSGAPPQSGGPQGAPAHPSPPEDPGGHSGAPPQSGGPQGESAPAGGSPNPPKPRAGSAKP